MIDSEESMLFHKLILDRIAAMPPHKQESAEDDGQNEQNEQNSLLNRVIHIPDEH